MENPFEVRNNDMCHDCGTSMEEGDIMYRDGREHICEDCAEERGIICECGNYKFSGHETCSNHND